MCAPKNARTRAADHPIPRRLVYVLAYTLVHATLRALCFKVSNYSGPLKSSCHEASTGQYSRYFSSPARTYTAISRSSFRGTHARAFNCANTRTRTRARRTLLENADPRPRPPP
eukprot:4658046-Pleurochrysis_carterae.AAC.4